MNRTPQNSLQVGGGRVDAETLANETAIVMSGLFQAADLAKNGFVAPALAMLTRAIGEAKDTSWCSTVRAIAAERDRAIEERDAAIGTSSMYERHWKTEQKRSKSDHVARQKAEALLLKTLDPKIFPLATYIEIRDYLTSAGLIDEGASRSQ